jgi:asparagine synthase (glutamine-hydrolysing)
MCGIAGILGAEDGGRVSEMTEALRHRGPDWQATIRRPGAHVGAARLRIVDLTGGDQPLVSARTGAVLVFNGEIYNFRELRALLQGRGHRFETASDSEVVLRAYEEYGRRCVEHLRGMYAFAIVDGEQALLARDPLGIKPLHYCRLQGGRVLAFASEIKSLLRCPDVPARINDAGLGDLRVFEYIADTRATLFEGIYSLEPGHCLEIGLSSTGLDVRDHAFADDAASVVAPDRVEAAEQHLDALLERAVRSHLVADVPIGLTLSGGIDSALLAMLVSQQAGAGMVSYVVGDDPDHVDIQQARRVARMLGLEHRQVVLNYEQYLEAIPASIVASEGLADGVPQYLLFREIGREFRVCLNGEGSDELFAGYPEHWQADRYVARIREAPKSLPLTERGGIERDRLLANPGIDCDDWMYRALLGPQLVDRHLHPLDRLSMASSVEVRVPFLDHDVAGYVRALPAHWRLNRKLGSAKYILRRAYLRRWRSMGGAAGLVDAVLREKRGFPDARRASQARFHQLCDRMLPDSYLSRHPRGRFFSHRIQALWFDLFEFLFCARRGALPDGFDVLDFLSERAGRGRSEVAVAAAAARR